MVRAYLDHASTSPLRPEARDAMVAELAHHGDPGRVHTEGRRAREALEVARQQVGLLLGARPREVVFTSGATESIATAVWGAATRGPGAQGSAMVVPAVEHSAVREACARHRLVEVGVDVLGRVDPDEVASAVMAGETALVNLQWANHEVGTVQPVVEVVKRCRSLGVLVHVDAAAAAGHVPVDFASLGADLMSISAHKMGGPLGVGALLVRRGLRLAPLLVGGDQERARRAGMENVAAIAGFGAAAEVVRRALDDEAELARSQTQAILDAALAVEGVEPYGDVSNRLPHLVCLGVSGVEAEAVVLALDQAGVAVHSGSACSSESLEPSPVLQAMGVDAQRSLRVSVGWSTTDRDIDAFATAFAPMVDRLRALAR